MTRRFTRSWPLLRRVWVYLLYGSQEFGYMSSAWMKNEARLSEYATWTERQREGAILRDAAAMALDREALFADRARRLAEMMSRESRQVGRPVVAFRARERA